VVNCDGETATLGSSWTTFHALRASTTVGAFTPILEVALAVRLAFLFAARMILHGTTCHWALFTTMQSFLGDSEHASLDSAITAGGARAVFTPTSFAIDWACLHVALLLLQISVAMSAFFATLDSVKEGVLTCL